MSDIAAILGNPERLPPGRLSKLQRTILTATAVAIYNDNGWEDSDQLCHHTVPRRTAYAATLSRYFTTDPDQSWERQERSHRTSFDRSLSTLFRRGYVSGIVLAWVSIGYDQHGNEQYADVLGPQGGGRRKVERSGWRSREHSLKRVGLTNEGWRSLTLDGQSLGELLGIYADDRRGEVDYHNRLMDLVGRVAAAGGAS